MCGGVLSLFVKLSRSKKSSSFHFTHLEIWKIETLRENNVENMGEKLSDKNDPQKGYPWCLLQRGLSSRWVGIMFQASTL